MGWRCSAFVIQSDPLYPTVSDLLPTVWGCFQGQHRSKSRQDVTGWEARDTESPLLHRRPPSPDFYPIPTVNLRGRICLRLHLFLTQTGTICYTFPAEKSQTLDYIIPKVPCWQKNAISFHTRGQPWPLRGEGATDHAFAPVARGGHGPCEKVSVCWAPAAPFLATITAKPGRCVWMKEYRLPSTGIIA